MASDMKRLRKPRITIGCTDHDRISRLANAHAIRNPEVAHELLSELARARLVADGGIAADVVRMGSTFRFSSHFGEDRRAMLVFPGEADIAQTKISILTPIGAALVGLSAGQSISWTARDGRVHRLTVDSVEASRLPAPLEQLARP
jgi:regulator of nucleoside diphosphate kinase